MILGDYEISIQRNICLTKSPMKHMMQIIIEDTILLSSHGIDNLCTIGNNGNLLGYEEHSKENL